MGKPLVADRSSLDRPRPLHEADEPSGNGNGNPTKLPTINGRLVDPNEVSAQVEEMGPEEAITWAMETFHPRLRFAVSFQKTSSVIVDIAHRVEPGARFFYLD